jgi:alpha-beta hydrolase superfamily lysophospholipase
MTTENLLSEHDFGSSWPKSSERLLERELGGQLFVRVAVPSQQVRATIIITHGLGEHSGRYGHVAAALVERGYEVVGWDLRGHGRSSGGRGDLAEYRVFLEDLREIHRVHAVEDRAVFFFGHSLGGQITLRFLQEQAVSCRGAIVASPWLRLAYDPPWWKLALARLAMRCWPGFIQTTGNSLERMSRDAAHMASFPDLDLVHHRISARMFFAVHSGGEQVLTDAEKMKTPLLLLHGDADPVTSHHASGEFLEKTGSTDKTLRIFPGSRHETHNDLDREQVIREIADWIEARLADGA